MQFNSVQKWNDYHMYFNHISLIDNKQLDRTQFLQLRNVFSNTYILYMN